MNASEQRAFMTLCLMAAFADGGYSEQARTLDVNKLLSVVRQP
jgi:hypothetical protein